MTIKKAIEKVIQQHGENTYAEIVYYNSNGKSLARRLDLENAIRAREQYEHDCVYESPRPIPAQYRLSRGIVFEDLTTYDVYSVDPETGEFKIDAVISVFTDLEYRDRAWRETFSETRYSHRGIPWWLKQ